MENNPLTNVDPSGHWCQSADGQYSHPGKCNDSANKSLKINRDNNSLDANNSGSFIIEKGIVTGVYYWDTSNDSVSEDQTSGLIISGVGGLGGMLAKAILKYALKTAGKEAEKITAKEIAKTAASQLSSNVLEHIDKHIASEFAKQLEYMPAAAFEKILARRSFFNPAWSKDTVAEASAIAYQDALKNGVSTGIHRVKVFGENIEVYLKDGRLSTAYGDHVLTPSYFGK